MHGEARAEIRVGHQSSAVTAPAARRFGLPRRDSSGSIRNHAATAKWRGRRRLKALPGSAAFGAYDSVRPSVIRSMISPQSNDTRCESEPSRLSSLRACDDVPSGRKSNRPSVFA
jgi:hypothetical protein